MEQKEKEPKRYLFFKGAAFEIIYNKESKFSNTQKALLYDLPTDDDLAILYNITVIKARIGQQDIDFDPVLYKDTYLNQIFEGVKGGVTL